MIFASHWFVVFAAAFFPVYWLVKLPKLRAIVLFVACAAFHFHFAGPAGMLPVVVLGTVVYGCALTRNAWACLAGIILCVAALVFYKYTHFLSTSVLGHFAPGLAQSTLTLTGPWLPLIPPLGISFFVFEFVHYLVDVRRGGPTLRNPGEFALFSIFFPSLVAGPIKRYQDFGSALRTGLTGVGWVDVSAGAQRVALGLLKKLGIADNLTQVIATYENVFAGLSTGEAWLFLLALTARIFFDFSGYSDIAIGLARMAGIRLPENFNWPYLATSIQDFWQRWHISLSSWIRDYVYIPLGGNRLGASRRVANGLIAFGLCGAWHGAAWNFVLWGLWHGLGLAVNSTYRTALGSFGAALGRLFDRVPVIGWAITFPFVAFGWLLFFYEPARAWAMAVKLVTFR